MSNRSNGVKSRALSQWVADMAELTEAAQVVWCDGSEEEKRAFTREAIATQVLIPLNPAKRPGCYLHRSNPSDVARSEHLTFVCTPFEDDAGPTNNWMAPDKAYAKLRCRIESLSHPRNLA